ncbi:MAG: acetyl-CoA acetyltransferase [Mycobacterium sp.]|nr:acetyl-CoA acetyltransferase [Mycobacterium sp.]
MAAGLDPRTPILVGSAALTQHVSDPTKALDAVALTARALRSAAEDAGGKDPHQLLSKAELIMMPQPSWKCDDPARMVAEQLGIAPHSLRADLGVLQQTMFTRACTDIAGGAASIVLICGGEARSRAALAAKSGVSVAAEAESSGPPDTVIAPDRAVISQLEIKRKLYVAARQYAIIETALRGAAKQTIAEHADEVAALWDGFADIARTRPEAWNQDATPLGDGVATPENPWYSWPYTKQHVSYWTVNQAAGLILCSVEAAESAGIPRDRWVFPHAAATSNLMVMLSERAELHRSPAIAENGKAIAELTGVAPADVDHLDLYSCFPAAVRVQAAELGIRSDRPWTVTGGMTFGGGPLNNYVLQSTARMADVLREDPGSTGITTSISGMITKQGLGLWSTTPPAGGFRSADTTEPARANTVTASTDSDYAGGAEVLGYTVVYEKTGPAVGIVIAKALTGGDPTHTIATTEDADVMADMMSSEWVGRRVTIGAGGQLNE